MIIWGGADVTTLCCPGRCTLSGTHAALCPVMQICLATGASNQGLEGGTVLLLGWLQSPLAETQVARGDKQPTPSFLMMMPWLVCMRHMQAHLRVLRLELRAGGRPALRAPGLARRILRGGALVLQPELVWDLGRDLVLKLLQALACCMCGQPECGATRCLHRLACTCTSPMHVGGLQFTCHSASSFSH